MSEEPVWRSRRNKFLEPGVEARLLNADSKREKD